MFTVPSLPRISASFLIAPTWAAMFSPAYSYMLFNGSRYSVPHANLFDKSARLERPEPITVTMYVSLSNVCRTRIVKEHKR